MDASFPSSGPSLDSRPVLEDLSRLAEVLDSADPAKPLTAEKTPEDFIQMLGDPE
jgi:hypothetical protein